LPRHVDKFDFTEEQQEAIMHLVIDNWGSNMQSGYDIHDNVMYLYAQEGPNIPVKGWSIDRDGTVIERA
jgi:hypothetical protein